MEQLQATKKSEINETEQQHVGGKKPHSKDHLPKSNILLYNEDPPTRVRTGASGGSLFARRVCIDSSRLHEETYPGVCLSFLISQEKIFSKGKTGVEQTCKPVEVWGSRGPG